MRSRCVTNQATALASLSVYRCKGLCLTRTKAFIWNAWEEELDAKRLMFNPATLNSHLHVAVVMLQEKEEEALKEGQPVEQAVVAAATEDESTSFEAITSADLQALKQQQEQLRLEYARMRVSTSPLHLICLVLQYLLHTHVSDVGSYG